MKYKEHEFVNWKTTLKEDKQMMKRIAVVLVSLLLTTAAFAGQNSNMKGGKKGNSNTAGKKKPAAAAADCSSMTDAQITAAVKDKLGKTPSLKNAKIDAATSGGVVTLTGKVKNGGLKGVATNQAKRASSCVKKVDNKCEVESHAAPNKNAAPKATKNKNAK